MWIKAVTWQLRIGDESQAEPRDEAGLDSDGS